MSQLSNASPWFNIHGDGPHDPEQKKQWRASGAMPYSLKVGDRYYSYVNTPLRLPLALIGQLGDFFRYDSGKSQSSAPSRYRANVSQLFKWIEHLEPWASEIAVIACHDRQVVADGCCGDVAVFDRHSLPFALKICPKLRPAYCGRDIKA